ncbi:MAG: MiaB/RimO family radical SAM methylthiotransferase [Candidatus Riflebacteria bacterium]|nr:MiaB/RimO family radical SAM methylthiotransferase [Candidatus Riflebacteria bacterium]
MNRRFAIRSLGCKVSQYDAERLGEMLTRLGLVPAGDTAAPDLFVLNSCSVTGRASQKGRQALRVARKQWPAARIVLAGCETALLARTGETPAEADGLLPVNPTAEIVEALLGQLGLLDQTWGSVPFGPAPAGQAPAGQAPAGQAPAGQAPAGQAPAGQAPAGEVPGGAPSGTGHDVGDRLSGGSRTRAFLKIQDGCNQFCSYCIVPHLRGRERSRSLDEVAAEGAILAGKGFREIVLTGIHLGRYEPGLVPVLRELERIEGLRRIRLSSIEPLEVPADLIDWLATSPAACPHLHLPLQAGSDAILRAMNRPYTTAAFAEVVGRVRARLPGIGLTTDLIVGFPGETDGLFRESLAFVERQRFSRIHIFRYSARPGTPAAGFAGRVANAEKQARSKEVERVWKESAAAFHGSLVGREVEVLWETCDGGWWQGFSREYVPCRCPGGARLEANAIAHHRVVAASDDGVEVT